MMNERFVAVSMVTGITRRWQQMMNAIR